MKKNLLTLMFVLAFVCGGLLVREVKASIGQRTNIMESSIQNEKSLLFGKSKLNISSVKKRCVFNLCDDWIATSAVMFDQMIEACNNAEGRRRA